MENLWDTEVIQNPNWDDQIQYFFSAEDNQCMNGQGMPLDEYESVRFLARRIYGVTKAGTMPMGDPSRRWNEFRLGTFKNWIANGSPKNATEGSRLERLRIQLDQPDSLRIRKNLSDIEPDSEEMEKLKTAFRGIINRSPEDPNSYFQISGLHWFPAPATYCVHGEDRYNPWHRVYLLVFENALRSVPGCEDVTLPYWDIGSGDIPDVLYEEPFDKYKFQIDVQGRSGIAVSAGEETERYEKTDLVANISSPLGRIKENIDLSLIANSWHGFNGLPPSSNNIIQAHNTGHAMCGITLETPDTAAFDPLFWFFHCNWDRLWWQWQRDANVQRLDDFRELLDRTGDDKEWLDDEIVGLLEPFGMLSNQTIDSLKLNVDYELPPQPENVRLFNIWQPIKTARDGIFVPQSEKVQVRLNGFNRLFIDGSVYLELYADQNVIATHYIFQSTKPEQCPTCLSHGKVDIDFEVEMDKIYGKTLDVKVTCVAARGIRTPVGLDDCGSPSINVNLPIE